MRISPDCLIHLSSLTPTHDETEYFRIFYTILIFDQKLWDVECLVRMRRALSD